MPSSPFSSSGLGQSPKVSAFGNNKLCCNAARSGRCSTMQIAASGVLACRWFRQGSDSLIIFKPETVFRWHRKGWKTYCAGDRLNQEKRVAGRLLVRSETSSATWRVNIRSGGNAEPRRNWHVGALRSVPAASSTDAYAVQIKRPCNWQTDPRRAASCISMGRLIARTENLRPARGIRQLNTRYRIWICPRWENARFRPLRFAW